MHSALDSITNDKIGHAVFEALRWRGGRWRFFADDMAAVIIAAEPSWGVLHDNMARRVGKALTRLWGDFEKVFITETPRLCSGRRCYRFRGFRDDGARASKFAPLDGMDEAELRELRGEIERRLAARRTFPA